MNINTLVPIAVVFVVAFFTISIGSVIMEEASEEFCPGTYVVSNYCAAGVTTCNSTLENPGTGAYFGCCAAALNASQDCVAWSGDSSINASQSGLEALDELASWGPTLALVIIAAIIIGVLVTYLARGAGGSV